MVETIVILLIVGGWLRALFVAATNRRSGFIALFAFSVFNIMLGLYDMQFVFNTPMPWPERLMVVVTLIVGVIATTFVGIFLRKSKINWQNLQNSYPRRKRTGYYGILPLRVQVLQKHGTHAASCGVFCENNNLADSPQPYQCATEHHMQ